MSAYQQKLLKLRPRSTPGYIYLIQVVGTDKFKIGRAINVPNRLRALQTGSPLKIRYVYHAYVKNANLCEMELHNKFSNQREIGEWFTLTPEDIKSCILLMRLAQLSESHELPPNQKVETEIFLSSSFPVMDAAPTCPIEQRKQVELIRECHKKGITTKNKILKEIWGVSAGGSQSYRDAKTELESLMSLVREEEMDKPMIELPEQNGSEKGDSERAERIYQLQAKGWGKAKIILEVWGVSKGGSPKYKAAEAEYRRLTEGG